ncbi:hematopoietic progenitor cell antigen CD34 [Sphaeramia orbicularis]|uniref:Hematopoietic progenitor cell antigen CD34-like n=1 Tax=Sphaeramia orbicularis TaxID=375764 RepID=A0A673C6F1_9TELE|nr:hematopoietic progenitor cell antigen CD34-like [Sphaeramia orbicularis]
MAASMWRMNGLWKTMAGVLLVCALLLSNGVMCQDDATDAPDAPGDGAVSASDSPPDAGDSGVSGPTSAPDASAAPSVADGADSAPSPAPGGSSFPATIVNVVLGGGNPEDDKTSGTSGPPVARGDDGAAADVASVPKLVVPDVKCVGEKDIAESNAVKAVVTTSDCEETKNVIQANPAGWCNKENCNLEIFQDGDKVLVASDDANLGTLAEALQSDELKNKLGVKDIKYSSSSGSSVFVGILITGLLAALAIAIGYFKCQRKADTKGVRLAEEAYPADQENQGNTLVSVAPLNPPPETQEKPSVNGESPEAAKTQPPPTNGHSTAKTADTEL